MTTHRVLHRLDPVACHAYEYSSERSAKRFKMKARWVTIAVKDLLREELSANQSIYHDEEHD